MKVPLVFLALLGALDHVASHSTTRSQPKSSVFYQPDIDESDWTDQPIPAENDPEIARILKIIDKPEPWDHLWYIKREDWGIIEKKKQLSEQQGIAHEL